MELYLKVNKKRKSVGRVDKTASTNKVDAHLVNLGLQNFKQDLVTTKTVRRSEELIIDLAKAGKAHLPEGSERFTYAVPSDYGVVYIPVNRLKQVYQSDDAINPKKVAENVKKMKAGTPLEPVEIGYNYDVHDGHHRWEAAKEIGYTHVPCKVVGTDSEKLKEAKSRYREVWKSFREDYVAPKSLWKQAYEHYKKHGLEATIKHYDFDSGEEQDLRSYIAKMEKSIALVLDLQKAMLNRGKLVRRQVVVKQAGGKTFTRMQWVDPHADMPNVRKPKQGDEEHTYAHHDNEVKELERRHSNKYPVVHHSVKDLHNNGKVDKEQVRQAMDAYHRGEKLPPVKINHRGEVVEGHHLVEMAKQLGLSHVPSLVMGNTQEKKRLEESLKDRTMVEDDATGENRPAELMGNSNRVNVTTSYSDSVNHFRDFVSKRYTKQHIMSEARRQGITWNESMKTGEKLDDYSAIMWMRAYEAVVNHIKQGKPFEVQHIERDVDKRMAQEDADSVHKHFLTLVEKHGGKQGLMEWARDNDILWKESGDPSIDWMRCATEIKKRLKQGKMVDGVRTRQKGVMDEANLVITQQHRDMVTALGQRYGKQDVMARAGELGLTWKEVDNKGNILPDSSPIRWMRASMAIAKHLAKGNTFTMSDEDDGTNGMMATVGDYGDGIKLTRYQGVAVDLGKRNSQNFEPKAREWGIKSIKLDNKDLSDLEATNRYEQFVANARSAKLMIHFDPFEVMKGGSSFLDTLSADGILKNNYEYGRVRDKEEQEFYEREAFGQDYDDAEDRERPIYGVLDLLNNGLQSSKFGDVAFVMKDTVKKRATGTYTDTYNLPWETNGKHTRSLEDPHHMIADRWQVKWDNPKGHDKVRKSMMDAIGNGTKQADPDYFEAHVHGGVDIRRDVDHVLIPVEWRFQKEHIENYKKLKDFAKLMNVPIKFHGEQ